MLRATAVIRKPAVKAEKVVDTVTLDHEGRQRRRVSLIGDGGLDFLLDLEKPVALNDGDALKLEDERLVRVVAAPQPLLEIRAENPLRLMRIAWHIGNRHTPAEITADALYIENDHVLAEMVRGQGGVARSRQPRPLPARARGAYDHDCGHDSRSFITVMAIITIITIDHDHDHKAWPRTLTSFAEEQDRHGDTAGIDWSGFLPRLPPWGRLPIPMVSNGPLETGDVG